MQATPGFVAGSWPLLRSQQGVATSLHKLGRPWALRSLRCRPMRVSLSMTTADVSASVPVGKAMSSSEVRQVFLRFYEERNHCITPSSSLIPDDPTILLTIAGMVPFKPVFLGQEQPSELRRTSSQKCIRTNDIENVGMTKRHHTFFEMLGNFSFGDYFKKQAIVWAWELLTTKYQIPPERLAVSVYKDDDESYKIWKEVVGVEESRILRLGDEDNFWASGATGPCGPCSEIYFDFQPQKGNKDIDLEDDDRFIELYNLVFMQSNRDADGNLTPLAKQNIDTGMGLERMCQVLQQVDNNYETDLMKPIMDCAAEALGISYDTADLSTQTSLKVMADHTRAVVHLITDGVRASNVGRGYILRRLVRRIVRHGRLLGVEGPFICGVAQVAMELAKAAGFEDMEARAKSVLTELEREEGRFLKTLTRGEERLEECLSRSTTIVSGEEAFELYDTFGFPLELTQEIAAERSLTVDLEGFEKAMEVQRVRARKAQSTTDLTSNTALAELCLKTGTTQFKGYDDLMGSALVVGLFSSERNEAVEEAEEGQSVQIILDRTTFYGEGGGQIGDRGSLCIGNAGGMVEIDNVLRQGNNFIHFGRVTVGRLSVGDKVATVVDPEMRRRVRSHHTSTHLLQAALRKVVSDEDISQAGSLVDGEKLRFDFNCGRAVTPDETRRVEDLINSWIGEMHDTEVEVMNLDEAKERGATAMFGEKYGNEVRVVDIPGVSMELCGGTHVGNTSEIGLFRITGESGIAAGVRRIEAVAGAAVLPFLASRDDAVKEICSNLKVKPEEVAGRVRDMSADMRQLQKRVEGLAVELAVERSMGLLGEAKKIGSSNVIVGEIEGVSADALKSATERLCQKLGDDGVVLLVTKSSEGKISFCTAAGKRAQKSGVHAGKLVGAVAKLCGGGGGGRPNLAQAGAPKDINKLEEALEFARTQLTESLS